MNDNTAATSATQMTVSYMLVTGAQLVSHHAQIKPIDLERDAAGQCCQSQAIERRPCNTLRGGLPLSSDRGQRPSREDEQDHSRPVGERRLPEWIHRVEVRFALDHRARRIASPVDGFT